MGGGGRGRGGLVGGTCRKPLAVLVGEGLQLLLQPRVRLLVSPVLLLRLVDLPLDLQNDGLQAVAADRMVLRRTLCMTWMARTLGAAGTIVRVRVSVRAKAMVPSQSTTHKRD